MYQGLQFEISQTVPQAVATGMFSSTVTIQQPSGGLGASGAPVQYSAGGFMDVPGLVDIPCIQSPVSEIRIQSTEMRELEEIMASAPRHILLNGYYPQIEYGIANGWLAIVDGGPPYIILGAESDSQRQCTRLEVKLVGI